MKFKIDENLPDEAAGLLRDAGYEAHTVKDENLSGSADPRIALTVQREQRALITLDTDFANIKNFPPMEYFGIIVMRPGAQDKQTVCGLVARLIPILAIRSPAQELWILEPARVRVRRSQ